MRVSSLQFFGDNIGQIGESQSRLLNLQKQISTGKAFLKPSDDPLAVFTAVQAQKGVDQTEQYLRNITFSRNQLGQMEETTTAASDVMKSIKELVIQARNGTNNMTDRLTLATDIASRADELFSIANKVDVNGKYLLSGTKENVPAFDANGNYQGTAKSEGQTGRKIEVSPDRYIDLSVTGEDAFVTDSGKSVFNVLKGFVAKLTDPANKDFQGSSVSEFSDIDALFNKVQSARTMVGTRQREIDLSEEINVSSRDEYKRVRDETVSVDTAAAISSLTQEETQLQAFQKTYAQVAKINLFDYLG